MSDPKGRAVCVGEVMIELLRGGDGRFAIACGGDTFNTAVYLARAGTDVGYAQRSAFHTPCENAGGRGDRCR